MKKRTSPALNATILLLCMAVASSFGQTAPAQSSTLEQQANEAMQSQQWTTAIKVYQQMIQAKPGSPFPWYGLAVSLRKSGDLVLAREALTKAEMIGLPFLQASLERIRLDAATGDLELAFRDLNEALNKGFFRVDLLETDSDLASLRADSRFPKAVERAKKNQKPCAYSPENRQFDFWVGDWNVFMTGGEVPAGSSKIELILGDCVVLENWSGRSGGSGKSFNIYNKNEKRWEQTWVDASGSAIFFFGQLKDGVMDYYTADVPQPDGTHLRRHLQFFNQGHDKVRQFSQGSTDGGKTWTVEYDLTYLRAK
ncbi:MAG: hypothetical protein LAO31_22665 [Acidobacteriia bacterium]|nr:hypothetical protein [Terriglobia bacterium]